MDARPRIALSPPTLTTMGASPRTDAARVGEATEDDHEWRTVFDRLHAGMGAATYSQRAARLSGYGWEPEDLVRACSDPRYVASLPCPDEATEGEAEALVALVDEARIYYSNGLSATSYARTGYLVRLADLGWTQSQLGRHVQLTKQRIQKLIKDWRRQDARASL